jgi:hypothetical protein
MDFVEEILTGNRNENSSCRRFDVVSSLLSVEKIAWPMFYIGCICKLFKYSDPSLLIGQLICIDLHTYSQTEESGKDWEVIVSVATIFRCLNAKLLDAVLQVVRDFYLTTKTSTILIVSLAYNKFSDFDLLVCFGNSLNGFECDGYQMKLS